MIVLAFFIARGFIKTGLGQRIGYLFVALVGKRTLGLSYGLIASDLVLAPAIPSNTAHVSAMYAGFLAAALAVGTPPLLAALVLGFASNLFGSMTHYGTGPAPVLFGSGYVDVGTWWKLGLVSSIVNILIWGAVGAIWWKVLGLY